jgi:hypothetical protein
MPTEIILPDSAAFMGAWMLDDLDICDELIRFHKANHEAKPGAIIVEGKNTVMKDYKDSFDSKMLFHFPETQRYLKSLEQVMELYKQKFPACTTGAPTRVEAVNVQEYFPGGAFHSWHAERLGPDFPENSRHLVYMTYLNDVVEGGETEFFHQQIKIKARRGLTVIWPTDWTHAHRGIPSPSQFKYIVTGWYQYYNKNTPDRPF